MKRFICLIISLCLILSSFSFCFAVDWSTTDQTNLSNAASRLYYNGYSAAYYLKQIADRVSSISTIASDITTIKGYLFDDGHSVAYWVSAISTWMSPILQAIQDIPDISEKGLLYDHPTLANTQIPYLEDIDKGIGNYYFLQTNKNSTSARYNNHMSLLDDWNGTYSFRSLNNDGSSVSRSYNWYNGSPIGNVALLLKENVNSLAIGFATLQNYSLATQNVVNWGNNQTSTFTPNSSIDGIYKYLAAIQAPAARLSYVLASDEEIAARTAAADNQDAVVDNFIDSTGDASASPSDIGSISDLSSGYQQNFGSTASVTGIFDIFESNNFGWFSSETYQQLDSTVAQRGSTFETPLLDQQLEDISRALGVDYAN